ncbi:MAG: PleD family two-component system response regulator [Saprospiraceae bacterium]
MTMTYTSTKKKHILVCDDDPEITEVISKTLELNPRYEVVSFGTGKEVLNYLNGDESDLPDLLILDLWLPDIDSDEIIPMLRKNPATRNIPIILISAIVNVEVVAREVGAESYLSKPFLLEELEYKVEQLVN